MGRLGAAGVVSRQCAFGTMFGVRVADEGVLSADPASPVAVGVGVAGIAASSAVAVRAKKMSAGSAIETDQDGQGRQGIGPARCITLLRERTSAFPVGLRDSHRRSTSSLSRRRFQLREERLDLGAQRKQLRVHVGPSRR